LVTWSPASRGTRVRSSGRSWDLGNCTERHVRRALMYFSAAC
jgi:hypothetical protein